MTRFEPRTLVKRSVLIAVVVTALAVSVGISVRPSTRS
jgi:hypothetical protein